MRKGFTLTEILVVTLIFTILAAGLFMVLHVGQSTWYTAEVAMEIQQDLRGAMMRLTKELHQSGFKCNNPPDCTNTTVQVIILSDAGVNNTDILRFKIPVDYNQDSYIKNSSGIVELWGANLTWGCLDYNCQRPLSPEPQSNSYMIEYLVDDSRHLLRRVLDDGLNPVRTDIYADNIENFQVTRSGNLVTIDLSASKTSIVGRAVSSNLSVQVLLRNKG